MERQWKPPRRWKRPNAVLSGICAWPCVGVMMALLFCVMVGTAKPLIHTRGPELSRNVHVNKLPKALREDVMKITMMRDGMFFWGNNRLELGDLPELIREGIRNGAEKRVYLEIDGRARYLEVKQVIDGVSLSGVRDVSFLVNECTDAKRPTNEFDFGCGNQK